MHCIALYRGHWYWKSYQPLFWPPLGRLSGNANSKCWSSSRGHSSGVQSCHSLPTSFSACLLPFSIFLCFLQIYHSIIVLFLTSLFFIIILLSLLPIVSLLSSLLLLPLSLFDCFSTSLSLTFSLLLSPHRTHFSLSLLSCSLFTLVIDRLPSPSLLSSPPFSSPSSPSSPLLSSSPTAVQGQDSMSVHQVTRLGPKHFIPSLKTVPLRSDPDSSQGVSPHRTEVGQETNEWL